MVFQRPVMLRRSALANVLYALNVAGAADAERVAREALAEVGLAHLAQRPARVLSGGEQQRLALARAWALHPEVLFLDEPTASLDPSATREIEAVISAFDAAGTKIVMATHNLGQARRLGDEVIYLHQGRVVERAPVERFFAQPAIAGGGRVHQRRAAMGLIASTSLLVARSCAPGAGAQQRYITVASTTSTEQSGLFKHLLPIFEKKTGIQVRVVALGTGQALDMGRRGDADVVFVHARPLEEKFVAEGYGVRRYEVMYNDFVLIGPKSDPAKVAGGKDAVEALQEDSRRQRRRSCRAATAAARTSPSSSCGRPPASISRSDKGRWYRETGQGMGPALNTAAGMNAYVLADRGTWLSFKNRGELAIAVEGDRRLFNQYGIMLVNPQKHPRVKKEMGQAFIDWLISSEGQEAIAAYKIGGEQLFFPERRQLMARYRGLTLRVLGKRVPAMGPGKAELIERIAAHRLDLGRGARHGHVLPARLAAGGSAQQGLPRARGRRPRRAARAAAARGHAVRPARSSPSSARWRRRPPPPSPAICGASSAIFRDI